MNYKLTITSDDGIVLYQSSKPSMDMLEEAMGAIERSEDYRAMTANKRIAENLEISPF